MNARVRFAFCIAALFAANVSALVAAIWLARSGGPMDNWASPAAGGLFIGGIMTLAIWLTFGDGKWYWRLVSCFCAVLVMAFVAAWIDQLYTNQEAFQERDYWWNMLAMLSMLLIGFTAMWPWWRIRGLNLTWGEEVAGGLPANQFQSRDLLFWTFAIAGVLAAIRALAAIQPFGEGWGKQIAILTAVIVLPLAVMHSAFTHRHTLLHGTRLLCLSLLIGGAFVTLDYLENISSNLDSPMFPWSFRVWPALMDSLPEAIPFISLTLLVLLNCLALRALGCRLVQRSRANRAGESAADFRG